MTCARVDCGRQQCEDGGVIVQRARSHQLSVLFVTTTSRHHANTVQQIQLRIQLKQPVPRRDEQVPALTAYRCQLEVNPTTQIRHPRRVFVENVVVEVGGSPHRGEYHKENLEPQHRQHAVDIHQNLPCLCCSSS